MACRRSPRRDLSESGRPGLLQHSGDGREDGREGGAPGVLIWTQRSMFSSDTAERTMTVKSQEMIITHCLSNTGLPPGHQAKRVFSEMQSKSHLCSPDLQFEWLINQVRSAECGFHRETLQEQRCENRSRISGTKTITPVIIP